MTSDQHLKNLLSFLNHSPTAWHAVAELIHKAKNSSFKLLKENEKWDLKPGQAYIVERAGTSVAAFVTSIQKPKGVRLIASHTDSPSLKIKPNPTLIKEGMLLFSVEVYGSPLLNSWLNRELGVAGKIVYLDIDDQIKEEIILIDDKPLIIPQLAIHLDREINEKGLILNKQEHLNALAGFIENQINQDPFESFISYNIPSFKKLLTHDLFLFPIQKAELIGVNQNLVASYRIDSLQSVYAAFEALNENRAPLEDQIKMLLFWNHEEIGSNTLEGAQSTFFSQIVERICLSYGMSREEFFIFLNHSMALSVDLAHAIHPNYLDKHDSNHRLKMGQGIVIKNNAQQRYATTANTAMPLYVIADKLGISLQNFVSRNDIPCGSTIGPLHSSLNGIKTVDIGCGQLSMHSAREIMASKDHLDLLRLLGAFLNY